MAPPYWPRWLGAAPLQGVRGTRSAGLTENAVSDRVYRERGQRLRL